MANFMHVLTYFLVCKWILFRFTHAAGPYRHPACTERMETHSRGLNAVQVVSFGTVPVGYEDVCSLGALFVRALLLPPTCMRR
jgi:hypothetical protein